MTAVTLLERLSLPHLRRSPLRSGLVVIGIALGVAAVVASRASSDALQDTFSELVQRIADRADLIVMGASGSGIPSSLVADIAEVKGVAHAAASLEYTTSFANDGEPLLILGVDFLGDTYFLPFRSEHGGAQVVDDPLTFVNQPDAIVLSKSLAARRHLHVGDRIELQAAGGVKSLEVRGLVADEGPAASFGGQIAVMFLDAAQVAFERGTLVDRIDVAVEPGVERAQVQKRIERKLAGSALVEQPVESGRRLRTLLKPLADGMQLSGLIALLAAVFIIYNAVAVSVAQRRREVGVLRALGVLRRDVITHFCVEALVLALFGFGFGLLLAQKLVQLAHEQTTLALTQVFGTPPAPPHITLGHVWRGAVAALVVSVLAAFWPARRGARLDPVAALSPTGAVVAARNLPARWLALAGALLTLLSPVVAAQGSMAAGYVATAMSFVGAALLTPLLVLSLRRLLVGPLARAFGATSRLGLDHARQSLGRSTLNVLALMVAVALSVGISGWLRSFETAVNLWLDQVGAADLVVTAGSPIVDRRRMPLAPGTGEKLAHVKGLAAVQPMRMTDQRYGDRVLSVVSSDTRVYLSQAKKRGKQWQVIEGRTPIAVDELYEAPRVVLSENAARRLGLSAGDQLKLVTPSGPAQFEVRAVVVDYSSELGAAFIDQRYYRQHWKDSAVDVMNLYLAPGADQERVAARVRAALGGGKSLFVTDTAVMHEKFMHTLEQGFAYGRSLELIVLLIAIMGVIGTMIASVLDRTREIGMLRAIGATRGQVATATVLEAAFLGLCATCGGIALGSLQCNILLETVVAQSSGWHIHFVYPLEGTLRVAALVLASGALSGLVPGIYAARLDVKSALASE